MTKKKKIPTVQKKNKALTIGIIASLLVVLGTSAYIYYINRDSTIIIDIEPIPADPDVDPDPDPEEPDPEVPIVYDDLSVLFHQSYVNDTTIEMNSTNNTLTVELPSDPFFNASNTQINVSNVEFYNYTLNDEHGTTTSTGHRALANTPLLTSFVVSSTCMLINVSVIGYEGTGYTRYYIYNSLWNGTHSVPAGNWDGNITGFQESVLVSAIDHHVFLSNSPNSLLNVSNTQNNTFFLGIDGSQQFRWAYDVQTTQYNYQWSPSVWVEKSVDFHLNLTFAPIDIELKINDSKFEDGVWSSTEKFNTNTSFVFGGWNNMSWDIDYVQMNFTKTFNVSVESLESSLRVVIPVSGFESGFENQYVRVSIDESFEITSIKYNDVELLEEDFERSGVNVFIYADFTEPSNLIFSLPFASKKEEE